MAEPIVFVGDSITELWGFHRAGTFEAYGLIPRGGSGQTARWITMRFARDLAETGARGVHLLCGVNDIGRNEGVFVPVEEICRTLAGMLDEARALGVKAWIGSLTPVDGIPWNPEVWDAPAMIAAVNAWLRDHAHEHGATFIDYHAVLVSESGGLRPDYGTDGLHLSPAGYAAIEPLMLRALGRIPDAPSAPALSVNGAPANTARSVRARLIGAAVAAAALLAAIAALVLELR
ncbi:GDSL-type esterase/lipase family protein [Methylobacterium sp. NPDC080182]|uniref:GDSL-type esterase/lipase family protein n=1 Tax=Methylobacterium sp. NPDC080182 TaxID=3390590 RepID=UPI003CFEB492